jgi:hypothetical protein
VAYFLTVEDIITKFFDALLDCYLPIECLSTLIEFLGMPEATTTGNLVTSHWNNPHTAIESNIEESCLFPSMPLISMAEACLIQAETKALTAEKMATEDANETHSGGIATESTGSVYDFYHPISNHFRDAMYSALMTVMEERDEAHARMVAADVMHVHELEQERNVRKHLSYQLQRRNAELESLKEAIKKGNVNSNTTSKESLPSRADSQTDNELVSLCQQLSAEIASRTSASLEILRLKESRKIERENEAAEREALERELQLAREALAQHKRMLARSQQESTNWKQSYEKALQRYTESDR